MSTPADDPIPLAPLAPLEREILTRALQVYGQTLQRDSFFSARRLLQARMQIDELLTRVQAPVPNTPSTVLRGTKGGLYIRELLLHRDRCVVLTGALSVYEDRQTLSEDELTIVAQLNELFKRGL